MSGSLRVSTGFYVYLGVYIYIYKGFYVYLGVPKVAETGEVGPLPRSAAPHGFVGRIQTPSYRPYIYIYKGFYEYLGVLRLG